MEIEMYLGERAQTYKLKPNNFQACWKVLKEKQLKVTERLQCKGNRKDKFHELQKPICAQIRNYHFIFMTACK